MILAALVKHKKRSRQAFDKALADKGKKQKHRNEDENVEREIAPQSNGDHSNDRHVFGNNYHIVPKLVRQQGGSESDTAYLQAARRLASFFFLI